MVMCIACSCRFKMPSNPVLDSKVLLDNSKGKNRCNLVRKAEVKISRENFYFKVYNQDLLCSLASIDI